MNTKITSPIVDVSIDKFIHLIKYSSLFKIHLLSRISDRACFGEESPLFILNSTRQDILIDVVWKADKKPTSFYRLFEKDIASVSYNPENKIFSVRDNRNKYEADLQFFTISSLGL